MIWLRQHLGGTAFAYHGIETAMRGWIIVIDAYMNLANPQLVRLGQA